MQRNVLPKEYTVLHTSSRKEREKREKTHENENVPNRVCQIIQAKEMAQNFKEKLGEEIKVNEAVALNQRGCEI